jgi:hypothetical protein
MMAENFWAKMSPDDGFFAKVELLKDVKARLIFGLTLKNENDQAITLEAIDWPTAQQIGTLKRKLILLEALAEYLNAGGNWEEAASLSTLNCWFLFNFSGWSYFDGGVNTNGNRVHEFISDDSAKFVRWVRNEYIDTNLTLEQIQDDSGTPSDSARCNQDDSQPTG